MHLHQFADFSNTEGLINDWIADIRVSVIGKASLFHQRYRFFGVQKPLFFGDFQPPLLVKFHIFPRRKALYEKVEIYHWFGAQC